MNSAFSVIKAEYQTNQTAVAAAIWLSFADFFFSGWSDAHFPQLSCLKHQGTQEAEGKKSKHEMFVIHEFILFRFASMW